ncbi:MAG TPA: GspH/FimT family protein [Sporichthya sp.]|jgi:type II secretory pathway pseudopilin PulG|nr:GspH/FimT family protein [Sporichthya sp.]
MRTVAVRSPRSGLPAAGFTLIEICWTMAIFFILCAIAVTPMTRWIGGERQGSTTAALEALLRETQQRSVTEGRSMCVSFNLAAQTYSVLRGTCASAPTVVLQGPIRPDTGVRLESASPAIGVTFYPRGTATPGVVTISRKGSARVDTLTVEGLTGRVSRA